MPNHPNTEGKKRTGVCVWVRARERVLNFLSFSLYLLILFSAFFVTFHWCSFGNCCYFMFCCVLPTSLMAYFLLVCAVHGSEQEETIIEPKQWHDNKQKNEMNAPWLLLVLVVMMVVAACFWSNRFRFVYGYFDVKPCAVCTVHIYGWLYGAMYAWTTIIIYIPTILFFMFTISIDAVTRAERNKVHAALDKMHICTKPSLLFRCPSPIFPSPSILLAICCCCCCHCSQHLSYINAQCVCIYKETGREC